MKHVHVKLSILLSLLLLTWWSGPSWAAPVTDQDAQKVASFLVQGQRAYRLAHGQSGNFQQFQVGAVESLKSTVKNAKSMGYVVNLSPTGFVVVAPDSDLPPVIAYSFKSPYYKNDDPENLLPQIVNQDMKNRLTYLPQMKSAVKKANAALWDKYLNADPVLFADFQTMAQWPSDSDSGWLKTTWDQGSPYNEFCPADKITATRCVTGCVATAMAQVLFYWTAPTSVTLSTETDSYVTTTEGINIDGDSTPLMFPNFEALNPILETIDYTETNLEDIAALNFMCGILVQMDYTSSESGAYLYKVAQVLTGRFGYFSADYLGDDAQDEANRHLDYSLLESNMKVAQPAILGISLYVDGTYNANHAIVCDGYRSSDNTYHLNFGWGPDAPDPISEAWYNLPTGMPADYNYVYSMTVNILPKERPVQVVTPNGGERWERGWKFNIEWLTASTFVDHFVNIYLYKGGAKYKALAKPTWNDGVWEWRIPSTIPPSDDYQIRIFAQSDSSINDSSDGYFTIAYPIRVTAPNGGESYKLGNAVDITWYWDQTEIGDNVTINLLKGDEKLLTIADSAPDNGWYRWTVPFDLQPDSDYKIEIVSLTNPDASDRSDSDFSIRYPVTVTYPNGGEKFWLGKTINVTWDADTSFIGNTVNIDLYQDGLQVLNIATSTPNTGKYSWKIPYEVLPSENCTIVVSSPTDSNILDSSDAPFTLLYPIEVVTPNGSSDEVQQGESYTIKWKADPNMVGDSVRIYLYREGYYYDVIYKNIAYSGTEGSAVWEVPADLDLADDYQIAVISSLNKKVRDYSDDFFSVVAPMKLLSPQYDSWYQGTYREFKWKSNKAAAGDTVYITLTDVTSYPEDLNAKPTPGYYFEVENTGSYKWRVPYLLYPSKAAPTVILPRWQVYAVTIYSTTNSEAWDSGYVSFDMGDIVFLDPPEATFDAEGIYNDYKPGAVPYYYTEYLYTPFFTGSQNYIRWEDFGPRGDVTFYTGSDVYYKVDVAAYSGTKKVFTVLDDFKITSDYMHHREGTYDDVLYVYNYTIPYLYWYLNPNEKERTDLRIGVTKNGETYYSGPVGIYQISSLASSLSEDVNSVSSGQWALYE